MKRWLFALGLIALLPAPAAAFDAHQRVIIDDGAAGGNDAALGSASNPIAAQGAAGSFVDGWNVTEGAKADAAYAGSGAASVIAALKGLYAELAATLTVQGTVTLGQTGAGGDATIAAGGTAQNLFAGATPTNGFLIGNPNLADDCWWSDSTTAAVNGKGSFRLVADGGYYETPPAYKPLGAISVICPTTSDVVSARKW